MLAYHTCVDSPCCLLWGKDKKAMLSASSNARLNPPRRMLYGADTSSRTKINILRVSEKIRTLILNVEDVVEENILNKFVQPGYLP